MGSVLLDVIHNVGYRDSLKMWNESDGVILLKDVRGSAKTPAPSTRNCAVDYRIAASIGVTDARVQ